MSWIKLTLPLENMPCSKSVKPHVGQMTWKSVLEGSSSSKTLLPMPMDIILSQVDMING